MQYKKQGGIMLINNEIEIRPVNKINWNDFETLFTSKGGPKYCWCMAWRMTKEELKNNTSECRKAYIKNRVFANIPIGILAYIDNEAIAWCSVAPWETYQRIGGDERINNVWSIACFYIKREYRKKGITNILIESAKSYARENGAKYIEAYPVNEDSPSYRFLGYVKQFEKAGFKHIKKEGKRRNVMTVEL
jgi:GNAT superfamily N-acetyltransferase